MINAKKRNYLIITLLVVTAGLLIGKYVPIHRLLPDASIRLVEEIEGAAKLTKTAGRHTIEHIPKGKPRGCSQDYTIQIDNSWLLFTCKAKASGLITAEYSTQQHQKTVQVSRRFVAQKKMGEPTFIYLEENNGQTFIKDVR